MILAYHSVFSMYGFLAPERSARVGFGLCGKLGSGFATVRRRRRTCAAVCVLVRCRRIGSGKRSPRLEYPPVAITGRQALGNRPGVRHGDCQGTVSGLCLRDPSRTRTPGDRRECSRHPPGRRPSSQPCNAHPQRTAPVGRSATMGRTRLERLPRSVEAIKRAIRYVVNNPLKEGKRRQNWSFVVPYVPEAASAIAVAAAAARAAKPPRRIGGAREKATGNAAQAMRRKLNQTAFAALACDAIYTRARTHRRDL